MGTPEFAVPTLASLLAASHDIAAVYTRAPKPAGRRGLDLTPTPIQLFAASRGLSVVTPKSVRGPEAEDAFRAHGAALGVVVGYGLILPPSILEAPVFGCLNLHPSLLPRWRGAAPIQRPIMAGDTTTAAAIMRMDEGLDTGPVGLSEAVSIPPDATAGAMHDLLATIGARLMVEAIQRLEAGTLTFTPQARDGVALASKIDKAEARLDWAEPATVLNNTIRGLSPFPGAFFEADFGKGPERVKVLRASLADGLGEPGVLLDDALTVCCGQGALRLVQIQRAGRGPMEAEAFLRGTPLKAGVRLGAPRP